MYLGPIISNCDEAADRGATAACAGSNVILATGMLRAGVALLPTSTCCVGFRSKMLAGIILPRTAP